MIKFVFDFSIHCRRCLLQAVKKHHQQKGSLSCTNIHTVKRLNVSSVIIVRQFAMNSQIPRLLNPGLQNMGVVQISQHRTIVSGVFRVVGRILRLRYIVLGTVIGSGVAVNKVGILVSIFILFSSTFFTSKICFQKIYLLSAVNHPFITSARSISELRQIPTLPSSHILQFVQRINTGINPLLTLQLSG